MTLKSDLFKSSERLQRCAVQDAAHVLPNDAGDHVGRIQTALVRLDSARIDRLELAKTVYGPTTTKAVLAYKTARKIVNASYQKVPDSIVGKMTIARLDEELRGLVSPSGVRRLTAQFLPAPSRSATTVKSVRGSSEPNPIAPLGPALRGNGFELESVAGYSWQMVPVGGERRLLLSGLPGQRFYFRLDHKAGADPGQIVTVSEVMPSIVPNPQEIRLVGLKEGWVELIAYDAADDKPVAHLGIDVLNEKRFTFGFVSLSDSRHRASRTSTPAAYIKRFNEIWTSQANISASMTAEGSIRCPTDLGDAPSIADMKAAGAGIKAAAEKAIGRCDRVIAFIWGMSPSTLVGATTDVIYIRQDISANEQTLAHEFGHSLGLKHEMAAGDPFNLMISPGTRGVVQDKLTRQEILKANKSPGNWHDVDDG